MKIRYVIARTKAGRPSLQHIFTGGFDTQCGLSMFGWSRAYQDKAIPEILCRNCRRVTRSGGLKPKR